MIHTVDATTQASTPGEIEISKQKYLSYIHLQGLSRLKYSMLLSLPVDFLYKHFSENGIIYDYIQKIEHFKYGCANPSMIINKEKGLIATFTNLTNTGSNPTPVIKISEERLDLIKNTKLVKGERIPSVALYVRNPDNYYASAWIDFDPKIANCFTDDLEACNHLLTRISPNAWQCLSEGLNQIKNKEEIGLYHVELNKKLVNDSY